MTSLIKTAFDITNMTSKTVAVGSASALYTFLTSPNTTSLVPLLGNQPSWVYSFVAIGGASLISSSVIMAMSSILGDSKVTKIFTSLGMLGQPVLIGTSLYLLENIFDLYFGRSADWFNPVPFVVGSLSELVGQYLVERLVKPVEELTEGLILGTDAPDLKGASDFDVASTGITDDLD